jgi:hypothetical protein
MQRYIELHRRLESVMRSETARIANFQNAMMAIQERIVILSGIAPEELTWGNVGETDALNARPSIWFSDLPLTLDRMA